MKISFALPACTLLALALSFGAHGADKSERKLSGNDRNFITEAAEGGMAEVELGKLAQQNGARADVKQFGQRMVEDHGKANEELKAVASNLGATVPAEPGKKHRGDIQKLSKLTGDKFDREYVAHMVKDHEKDISAFEKQSKKGDAQELKQFAAKSLPTLQEHLKMARAMRDGAKK